MRSQDSLLVRTIKTATAPSGISVANPQMQQQQQQQQPHMQHHQRQHQRQSPLLLLSASTASLATTGISGGSGGIAAITLGNKSATIGSPIRHSSGSLLNSHTNNINNNNNSLNNNNNNSINNNSNNNTHNAYNSNELPSLITSHQQQNTNWNKLQSLEQRKAELEKLLNEKNWLLQQIHKQETQILNGNYENFNFNEILANLHQHKDTISCSGGGSGSLSSGTSNSAILRRKGCSSLKLNSDRSFTNSICTTEQRSNGPKEIQQIHVPRSIPIAPANNHQLSSSSIAAPTVVSKFTDYEGNNVISDYHAVAQQQQLKHAPQSQNVMILKKRQVPTNATRTLTNYRESITKSPSFAVVEQQQYYHQNHMHTENIPESSSGDSISLLTSGSSMKSSGGGVVGGNYHHPMRQQSQKQQNDFYTGHINTDSSGVVQCDKYYLSPTNQTFGDGFIKSSQNIKKYMSPLSSPSSSIMMMTPTVVMVPTDDNLAGNRLRNNSFSESPRTGAVAVAATGLGGSSKDLSSYQSGSLHLITTTSGGAGTKYLYDPRSSDTISLSPSAGSVGTEAPAPFMFDGGGGGGGVGLGVGLGGGLLRTISTNDRIWPGESQNCYVVETPSQSSNHTMNFYGDIQQHPAPTLSAQSPVASASSVCGNFYTIYSPNGVSLLSVDNNQGNNSKASDEISISSINSETQKKQPKKKQWMESSLDGPVIRTSILSSMPDIIVDNSISVSSSSRTYAGSNINSYKQVSPPTNAVAQQKQLQAETAINAAAAANSDSNILHRSINRSQGHLSSKGVNSGGGTGGIAATGGNYRERSKLSSQSMSSATYRAQKSSKLHSGESNYPHLSQSTSILNVVDSAFAVGSQQHHHHHHYQQQQQQQFSQQQQHQFYQHQQQLLQHQQHQQQQQQQQQHQQQQQRNYHAQQQQQISKQQSHHHNATSRYSYHHQLSESINCEKPKSSQSLLRIAGAATGTMMAFSQQQPSTTSLPLSLSLSTLRTPTGAPLTPPESSAASAAIATTPVSADIRIESSKNMTIIQQATFLPYKEVTKPFEMSDFYKYSTKFRHKELTPMTTIESTSTANQQQHLEIQSQPRTASPLLLVQANIAEDNGHSHSLATKPPAAQLHVQQNPLQPLIMEQQQQQHHFYQLPPQPTQTDM